MSSDQVSYLNPHKFFSKLRDQIEAAKMAKMPPLQWAAFIKGLTGKGVKQAEIDDSKILAWLNIYGEKSLTKEELLGHFDRTSVTVKEVVLGSPKYQSYSHAGAGDVYQELLYIANSEASNMTDRIEEIEFTMEGLSFDHDRLASNPGLASKLVLERAELMRAKPTAIDFENHHFSDKINGKHGKNLLFHIRVVISKKPDGKKLFFIDEIQSDWGQRGRLRLAEKNNYRARGETPPNWRPGVPKGPWVEDTKLWAGLAVRRVLQRAAADPDVDEVSWIRLAMRNGGMSDPRAIDAAAQLQQAAAAQDEDADENETDHYYRRLIPSVVDGILGKSGAKVTYDNVVTLRGRAFGNLPGFKMTDAAREHLSARQPLYSALDVLKRPAPVSDERLEAILTRGQKMLGSAAKIRFTASIMNLQDMSYKSGSYMNRLLQVALNSKDLDAAMDHEAYHCAHELFLTQRERNAMLVAFRPDGELNHRVRERLVELGEPRAARQCSNSEEAAAHAFSLWNRGDLKFAPETPDEQKGIFQMIKDTISDVVRWVAGESIERGINTPEKVFVALRDGVLSQRYEGESVQGAPKEKGAYAHRA